MKKLLFGCLLALTSLGANAFDRWVDDTFSGGETVYSAGVAQVLVVGARGVGITINPNVEGHVMGGKVSLILDDGKIEEMPIKNVGFATYLIDSPKELVSRIADSKKVEIQYNRCMSFISGCPFTYKGDTKKTTWEFDTSLSQQFKDYQERIR